MTLPQSPDHLLTILYEDSRAGQEFALHNLVLRMVEDEINGQTWVLRQTVAGNPKRGIDKLLSDIEKTSTIAGAGMLFALIDRDRIVHHVNKKRKSPLQHDASDDDVIAAISQTSDAPEKLQVFFLNPNMEGLIRDLESCASIEQAHLPQQEIEKAKKKDNTAREIVLKEATKAGFKTIRDCIRTHQQGIHALVKALIEQLSHDLA